MADFAEIYNITTEDISSPNTVNSDQNSPSFFPENSPSDVDEDFVPGRFVFYSNFNIFSNFG